MNSIEDSQPEVEGRIIGVLPANRFRVELDSHQVVIATISSKMWKRWVRLNSGNRVRVEMPSHDTAKARITWRLE
jgi:translation initiation factor IF-1